MTSRATLIHEHKEVFSIFSKGNEEVHVYWFLSNPQVLVFNVCFDTGVTLTVSACLQISSNAESRIQLSSLRENYQPTWNRAE